MCVPAVVERRRSAGEELGALLDALVTLEAPAAFVFSTGVGTRALFDEARALGRAPELLGPSGGAAPSAVARRRWPRCTGEGVGASLKAASPLHHGRAGGGARHAVTSSEGPGAGALRGAERGAGEALVARRPVLAELLVYGWELPEDIAPLAGAGRALDSTGSSRRRPSPRNPGATSHAIAERIGRREALVEALRSRVVVAAVGPTCARVLEELASRPTWCRPPRRWARWWTRSSHDLALRSAA